MSKICPRCKKLAKKDADGFTCITCGWTEYVIPPLKKLTGHIPYADRFYLPYRGANPKHRGVSGAVITLLWQTKKKLDRVFYFMTAPLTDVMTGQLAEDLISMRCVKERNISISLFAWEGIYGILLF